MRDLITIAGVELGPYGWQWGAFAPIAVVFFFGPVLTLLLVRIKHALLERFDRLGGAAKSFQQQGGGGGGGVGGGLAMEDGELGRMQVVDEATEAGSCSAASSARGASSGRSGSGDSGGEGGAAGTLPARRGPSFERFEVAEPPLGAALVRSGSGGSGRSPASRSPASRSPTSSSLLMIAPIVSVRYDSGRIYSMDDLDVAPLVAESDLAAGRSRLRSTM